MSMARAELKGPRCRSAVRSTDTLLKLVEIIDQRAGLHFRGVVNYDTQRNHFGKGVTISPSVVNRPALALPRLRRRVVARLVADY